MKTLGQIAHDAFDAVDGRLFSKSWEAAAQAVRAAVLEEAATELEAIKVGSQTTNVESAFKAAALMLRDLK